jgi:hypothetical protein
LGPSRPGPRIWHSLFIFYLKVNDMLFAFKKTYEVFSIVADDAASSNSGYFHLKRRNKHPNHIS